MKLSESNYESFSKIYRCGGSFRLKPERKTDCYFYHEEKDMGATIPCCTYFGGFGNCPCENCKKYFEKRKVYEIVKKIVDDDKQMNCKCKDFQRKDAES